MQALAWQCIMDIQTSICSFPEVLGHAHRLGFAQVLAHSSRSLILTCESQVRKRDRPIVGTRKKARPGLEMPQTQLLQLLA